MTDEATTLLDLFSSSTILTEHTENASYLNGLPSFSLSDLLAAPTALSTQSHTLTASLNALAHTSYPTILSLHDTSSALLDSLSSLDASLNSLLDTALPALDDVARTFREKSGPTVIEERQRTRVVLEQYDKLRDLLDVPVLMDTCIRNGLYAEALALAGHATTALSALSTIRPQDGETPAFDGHPPPLPLPLVNALQTEIESSLYAMRLLLLGTLQEPGRKLPAFWKAVQFLRKMQVMPESALALAFVSARIDCLKAALQAVERDTGVSVATFSGEAESVTGSNAADREKETDRRAEDVSKFLKKYIDVWREGAYDLVTQYTTMFLERASPHAGTTSSSQSLATNPLPDPVIKHTLPPALLDMLLPTIKAYLGRAYPHLGPIATQLAYCSSAMARIGMVRHVMDADASHGSRHPITPSIQEFRLLLSPLITRAVIDGFARDIESGAEREWPTVLAKHGHWSGPSDKSTTLPSKWLVASSPSSPQSLPSFSSISIQPSSPAHAPPQLLTVFPPLAVTLNAYLRVLNRLRALAPMDALGGVLDALESGLAKNGEALLGYAQEWRGDAAEREVVHSVGAAYFRVLVPFLRRAVVEGVFGVAYDSDMPSGDAMGGGARLLKDVMRNWESWSSETTSS